MSTTHKITSTIRCELVKPLGMSWDELGSTLRALQAPLHRALNEAVSELELMRTSNEHGIDTAHWDSMVKSRKERAGHVHPQAACYQLVLRGWRREREAAAARLLADKSYSGDETIATVEPSGALVLGMTGLAYARWEKFNEDRWRGASSLPTFNKQPPLCIASSNDNIMLRAEDGLYVLSLALLGGRSGRVELVIRPYKGKAHGQVRQLLAGQQIYDQELERLVATGVNGKEAGKLALTVENSAKLGDARLVYDSKKKKWQVMISWTRPVPQRPTGGAVMSVHRGIHSLLTCAIDRGAKESVFTKDVDSGHDIVAHKRSYEARRTALGKHRQSLGTGARGHGLARREEHITRLRDKESDWVRTRCQQAAARVVQNALRHGVSKILIEDWSNPVAGENLDGDTVQERLVRSFPFGQLKESILWAAKGAGLAGVEVATFGHSRTCPVCRIEGRTYRGHRGDMMFECEQCELKRTADAIAAWNMLVEHNQTDGKKLVGDANQRTKRAAKKIKAGPSL